MRKIHALVLPFCSLSVLSKYILTTVQIKKRLLEICRNTDLSILNDIVSGDSLGRPTFHSKSSVSVIDYAICDQDLFRHIANFTVKEPSSYSDHSPIITWININTIDQNPVAPIINDTLLHLPKQFIWENESPQKFRATLQTEHVQRMINEFLDDTVPSENVITSLDAVETIFTTTAKRCLKIKTTKKRRHKISFNKKWFDKECRLKRHELRKLQPRSQIVVTPC